jgi:hypothetical protein
MHDDGSMWEFPLSSGSNAINHPPRPCKCHNIYRKWNTTYGLCIEDSLHLIISIYNIILSLLGFNINFTWGIIFGYKLGDKWIIGALAAQTRHQIHKPALAFLVLEAPTLLHTCLNYVAAEQCSLQLHWIQDGEDTRTIVVTKNRNGDSAKFKCLISPSIAINGGQE